MGTAGWLCQARGCRQAWRRDPECPLRAQSPSWEQACHPQICERPSPAQQREADAILAPGSPASRNAALALGNPLLSQRDKGREQRKNHFSKCYLFWHALRLSARSSPTAAEASERCCSPVENDIHPCQAFGAALGLQEIPRKRCFLLASKRTFE